MALARWIVNKRKWLFFVTLAIALVCLYLMTKVTISSDMSKYLPDDSTMKQGLVILQEKWSELPLTMGSSMSTELPSWIVTIAIILVIVILVLANSSFTEPILYLFAIGMAILINLGSNYITQNGSISDVTASIAALLQLVLSLDYSVMLANRFRQECNAYGEGGLGQLTNSQAEEAMVLAVRRSAGSVLGSGMTTVVGLLTMIYMSFRIGGELGVVLAKGALCSMICVFTMLPTLILWSRKLIARTSKKPFNPPTKGLAAFSYRYRIAILIFTIILAASAFILKRGTRIAYILDTKVETPHVAVLVYENEDEAAVTSLLDDLNDSEGVNVAIGWGNTIGACSNPADIIRNLPKLMKLYQRAEGLQGMMPEGSENMQFDVNMIKQMDHLLKKEDYSLALIDLNLPKESDETYAFFDWINENLSENASGRFYLVGESVMAWELSKSFGAEMDRMTIITAGAIFLVVLLTFRSIVTPAVLVLMIQTAVYITMVIIQIQGNSIYYLAFLMVQSILMGATIDYAIVYSKYYKEARKTMKISESIAHSYKNSINVTLTSSSIIIIVTLLLGFAFPNPTVGAICHTISMGNASALFMVLFLLPGILGALDRKKADRAGSELEADDAVKKLQ